MKLYKLTNTENQTQNNTQWGEGVTHSLPHKSNPKLRSSDIIHAYKSIELALLLNPIHANIANPHLWKAEGDVVVSDWGKVGVFSLTTVKELKIPNWYLNKNKKINTQIKFAILCAENVLHIFEEKYPQDNRPRKAIEAAKIYLNTVNIDANAAANAAAYDDAYDAANAAANAAAAAAYDAANAANAAAYATYAAAYAATYDAAANTAYAAANATYVAAYAVVASVAVAANDADTAKLQIDFNILAKQAIK